MVAVFLFFSIANDCCLVDTIIKELVAITDSLLITMCLFVGAGFHRDQ